MTNDQINDATHHIRNVWSTRPRVGLVLGSGLGELVENIDDPITIPYEEIPHFPRATAIGHAGALVCGHIHGLPVVTMQGRFHLYEGYSPQQAALPIRVMHRMGIELVVLSNAVGGLNPAYKCGDLMFIDDHINLMFHNPLIGENDDNLGPRFPDMSRPYDFDWIARGQRIAQRHNIKAHRGVYAGLCGPTYETRAEYRMLRSLGADVVGMSTVPETIAAVHAGLPVLAISVVTNVCRPDSPSKTDSAEVIATAAAVQRQLQPIVLDIVREISAEQ